MNTINILWNERVVRMNMDQSHNSYEKYEIKSWANIDPVNYTRGGISSLRGVRIPCRLGI